MLDRSNRRGRVASNATPVVWIGESCFLACPPKCKGETCMTDWSIIGGKMPLSIKWPIRLKETFTSSFVERDQRGKQRWNRIGLQLDSVYRIKNVQLISLIIRYWHESQFFDLNSEWLLLRQKKKPCPIYFSSASFRLSKYVNSRKLASSSPSTFSSSILDCARWLHLFLRVHRRLVDWGRSFNL